MRWYLFAMAQDNRRIVRRMTKKISVSFQQGHDSLRFGLSQEQMHQKQT